MSEVRDDVARARAAIETLNLEQLEALNFLMDTSPMSLRTILIYQETYMQIKAETGVTVDSPPDKA